ncbi:hypothetical protein [Oceanobacillus oncorhynchi]|uniref:hypothetical protein n=1 Tax=Oceanobacillus oncorhynchi TaxID=545501 RepID=UPI002116E7EA|nr:hypothetical protein [Oceanobacillus oncorhynchi]UUI41137.1 hypothetical protein NP440_06105 [Oceanobacillus oncorhynchi]
MIRDREIRNGEVGIFLEEMLEIAKKTNQRGIFIELNRILEMLIGHYFMGNNYENDGMEWSREDSKIMAYQLLNTLHFNEMILEKEKKRMDDMKITSLEEKIESYGRNSGYTC